MPDEVQDEDLIISLSNGGTIRCGPGEDHLWGGHVAIHADDGRELVRWTADEWEAEGESVMGAIFGAALADMPSLKEKFAANLAALEEDDDGVGMELNLAVVVPASVTSDAVAALIEPAVREALASIGGSLEGFTIDEGEAADE